MEILYEDKNIALRSLGNNTYDIALFKDNHWRGCITFNYNGIICDELTEKPINLTAGNEICDLCGGKMIKNLSKVLTSYPPQYEWKCEKCGAVTYKFY